MKKIAISILALAAVTTAALAGSNESYDGSVRKGQIVLKPGTPKFIVTSPLAIGVERMGKSNYQILREKAAADTSGGPGVNN